VLRNSRCGCFGFYRERAVVLGLGYFFFDLLIGGAAAAGATSPEGGDGALPPPSATPFRSNGNEESKNKS
jgi:hypothetical protein